MCGLPLPPPQKKLQDLRSGVFHPRPSIHPNPIHRPPPPKPQATAPWSPSASSLMRTLSICLWALLTSLSPDAVPVGQPATQPTRRAAPHSFQAACAGPHHSLLNELSSNVLPNQSYSSSEKLPAHKMTPSLTSVKSFRGSQYPGGRANFSPHPPQAESWVSLSTLRPFSYHSPPHTLLRPSFSPHEQHLPPPRGIKSESSLV